MLRRTHILVTLAAAAMLSGCPDSAPPMMTTDAVDSRVPDGAEDTLTDGPGELPDDTLPPDGLDGLDSGEETHDQADGTSDGDAPPPPPELTFCLVTPVAGCVGADQEIIELVKNAETSDDLYPATPALEVDVQVTTGNLPEGTEISLVVDGSVVASQFLPADGTLDFAMVQLTHAVEPDCHVVEVAAGDLASVSRTVCVDTGACGITLEPANLECLHEDENPELAGFQATFTVTSGGTDCDQAWIAALEESTEPVTLDGGQAVIEVTLAPMVAGLDCHAVELAASVGSSGDPSRTATLERAYVLDTVSPVLTIVEPTAQTVNLGDDLDGDPDNGIQILLEGTATGLAPDDLVAVILDGDEVAVVPADGGTFLLEELTLDGDGLHTIEVHAVEACCGEAASDAIGVVALLSPSNVMLLSPLEGSVVLAQEDMDLQTPLILEDGFLVYAPLAEAGEFLQIQCRRNKAGSIWGVAGSLAVPAVEQNGIYTVSVALDVAFLGTEVICRARDGASPPFFSPEVAFSVALPAPILTLVAPVTGDLLVPASFAAVASASNLAGRTATLTLLKDNVEAWSEALPITPTGFFLAEDLSSLEDGVYTLAVQASDAWGNEAGDHPSSVVEAVFELDGTPPGLSLLYPQQGMSCNATTCPDASSVIPGHQFPFQALVSGEPHPDLTEVCFALNGDTPVCLAANAITGQAVLDTLTVISGDNSVVVTATDGAGHSVSLSAVSFTFVADMPRIKMPSPPGNVVIASLPLAITVLVASPDGVTSLEDAEVSLLVDGAVVETLNAGPGGVYGFSLDGLTVGVPVVIQARATHASTTDPGYSGTRTILLKEGIPAITLTAPADGEILSLASAECSGSTGCTLTIAAETTNAEDKSPATLDVDCGGPAVQETGEVQGGQVFFPGVTLPEGATCTLTASVTDLAGQEAASAPVTVTVDRIAPVLGAFVLPVFELLPAALDEDPGTPGYQYTVIVSAGGLEAGRAVQLSIAPEVGAAEVIETVLAGPIPDG
ncbi:MAG: hypothetical protein FJ098_08715, partial [Deltaproteobacteria bacterium]|nr:hypothetical protein [Deltaproteobacteria bacterium]